MDSDITDKRMTEEMKGGRGVTEGQRGGISKYPETNKKVDDTIKSIKSTVKTKRTASKDEYFISDA
jgi:hypothetical protein